MKINMLSPYNPIGCKLLCVYYRFKKILSNVTSSSDVIASFSETATLFSSKMRFSVKSRPDFYNWYYWVILSEVRAFHDLRNPEQLHWSFLSSHIIWQPNVYSALIFSGISIQALTHNTSLLTATILRTCWGGPRSWLNRWLSRWLGRWTSWLSRWLGRWPSWLSRWLCGWRSRGDFWKHTRTWAILRL